MNGPERPDERPRILVVDDELHMREVLELGLMQHGFDVRAVADGPAGLAAVREWEPDAIVLDARSAHRPRVGRRRRRRG